MIVGGHEFRKLVSTIMIIVLRKKGGRAFLEQDLFQILPADLILTEFLLQAE